MISPILVIFIPAVFPSRPGGCEYPQASPPLEFTVLWAGLLIKHMWTCRGMGRDRGLRTASLCAPALKAPAHITYSTVHAVYLCV